MNKKEIEQLEKVLAKKEAALKIKMRRAEYQYQQGIAILLASKGLPYPSKN